MKKRTLKQMIRRAKYRYEYQASVIFALFLVVGLVTSIGIAYGSAGSLVLGSEMNSNGTVEYLCLGRSCEDTRSLFPR